MEPAPNAVELTVDHAWFIAETIGAGSFPWVLAITCPYRDAAERNAFLDRQKAELTQMGLVSEGGLINPAVAEWIKVVCFPERWLDLRYVGPPRTPVRPAAPASYCAASSRSAPGPAAGRRGRWSRCAARS